MTKHDITNLADKEIEEANEGNEFKAALENNEIKQVTPVNKPLPKHVSHKQLRALR